MKQLLIRGGEVVLEDVPPPTIEPGSILVRSIASCVSIGTELATASATSTPLWRKVLEKPALAGSALHAVHAKGLSRVLSDISWKLAESHPIGYSASGVVLEVDEGVKDFKPGDRIACAGGQCAYHAEIVRIPAKLAVAMPAGISFAHACTVALGSIALQGVRRASPTLGETVVVVGLGALGLLSVQILKANGCKVLAIDPDPQRTRLAAELGADGTSSQGLDAPTRHWLDASTCGAGADAVVVTASSRSSEVVSDAFQMCRKKGRVVIVGDVGLGLRREDFYAKEIDLLISCSYGPGRYDPTYEGKGHDYPLPYVRWTENRNMQAYLALVAEGKVRLDSLIQQESPFLEAPTAYERIRHERPTMAILTHDAERVPSSRISIADLRGSPRMDKIRLGVIGAGGFTKAVHLPHISDMGSLVELRAVCNRSGHTAQNAADRFGAAYACTDYRQIIDDPDIDAILIGTRHDLHGKLALDALQAGKHVLVEKPTAITSKDIDALEAFHATASTTTRPLMMTAYNRRFSPLIVELKKQLAGRMTPLLLEFRMNAGYLPIDHWTLGPEGGGRNIGEACHVYDLFRFLVGSPWKAVHATSLGADASLPYDFSTTISFQDGSMGLLVYTTVGSAREQKEMLSASWDGKTQHIHDFRYSTRDIATAPPWLRPRPDKGHRSELDAFFRAIRDGLPSPISITEQFETARLALAIEELLRRQDP